MLRALQKQRVARMLTHQDAPLKILILDKSTQALLGPLFRVSDLRECGVTCHFLIESKRDPIKDAPAFYFLSNPALLPEEMQKDLYASYYLHSSASFRRTQLEHVALRASELGIANKVKAVFDQFLYFISLQDNLFSLNITDSFANLEDPDVVRTAVTGLVSVSTTLGEMPFILSATGCEVAEAFGQRIKNMKHLKNGVKRPLFIILNRTFDIFTPIRHVMNYAELIHDIFGISANKVHIDEKQSYELDVDSDFFKANAYVDFPIVAEVVEKELAEYKKEMSLRSIDERSSADEIQQALENTPHLQKKNEIIGSNLNICMQMLTIIKERHLDEFYHIENTFDKDLFKQLSEQGSREDILRLGLTMLLGRNADMVEPLFAKAGIKSSLVELFKANVRQGGLRERLSSLIFKKNLPVASFVEDVLSAAKNQSYAPFYTCDPAGKGLFASEISKIVVYIHGGATYAEMHALKELENSCKIPIILGGSEILNATGFMDQIERSQEPA